MSKYIGKQPFVVNFRHPGKAIQEAKSAQHIFFALELLQSWATCKNGKCNFEYDYHLKLIKIIPEVTK